MWGVPAWESASTYDAVAQEIRDLRERGLGHLLTEETVRFATAQALVSAGVVPESLRTERPHPIIKGARIDLAVGEPETAFIEFKYPREPAEKNAAWTMTLGEVLKDLYRLAAYPGQVDRIFVYAESRRLRDYMTASSQRYGVDIDRTDVSITPAQAGLLPATATAILGHLSESKVTATRLTIAEIDDGLRLAVYRVDEATIPADSTASTVQLVQQTGELANPTLRLQEGGAPADPASS